MDKKIIFVNATSATVGGSLTILKQFIENIVMLNDDNKKYYIFTPIDCEIKSTKYFDIIPIKAKSYKDRIIWDLYGMEKWSKNKKIYPNLILSLQNTGVRFGKVKQIIYLHQPLPYSKESKWSPLKNDERKMWFYKHIYKIWIDLSIKKYHKIVVQTKWMKDALLNDGYNKDNIVISRPKISNIDIDEVCEIKKEKDKYYFFYPAADYKYKNHDVIIDAMIKIKKYNPQLLNKIKIIFTLDKKSKLYEKIKQNNLEFNFSFLGTLNYQEVLRYYKTCNIVLFPSYIETFGLPLIEARQFGKLILVSDCLYSREVLEGYENVKFINCKSSEEWMNAIIKYKNSNLEFIENNIETENGWYIFNSFINKVLS